MKPWTEAHRREAEARIYALAAELARNGHSENAKVLVECLAVDGIDSEQDFRDLLFFPDGSDLGVEQIEREVSRCRDFAEGRRVRETTYRVGASHYRFPEGRAEARFESKGVDYPVYRSTRTRRAVPR